MRTRSPGSNLSAAAVLTDHRELDCLVVDCLDRERARGMLAAPSPLWPTIPQAGNISGWTSPTWLH